MITALPEKVSEVSAANSSSDAQLNSELSSLCFSLMDEIQCERHAKLILPGSRSDESQCDGFF